jgi:adenylylsulfate kinase-like enzyme
MKGFTLWFTASSSGKSTLARQVEQVLLERGIRRSGSTVVKSAKPEQGLGFSKEDRHEYSPHRFRGEAPRAQRHRGRTAAIFPSRRDEMRHRALLGEW